MSEISEFDEQEINELLEKNSLIDIYIEMFRRGDFSFIVEGEDEDGNIVSHEKQREALEILTSGKYDEFLYGGAAGGAKTWTGCVWILFMHLCYPGTKSFIGRNELGDIIDSVKVTFDKVCKAYGFTDYKFNAVKNFVLLGNGSHINFIEVKFKPSDKMYEDVGSTEYTFGWGEEIGEWHETAATVLASRVGRHLNKKDADGNYWTKLNKDGKKERFKIRGTVLWTCNPKKNWGKREFHDKHHNGTLENNKAYLQCLITENPFIEKDYVEKLRKIGLKNKSLFERLFKGNWDYEDNPNQLPDQESIDAVFDNDHNPEGLSYITCDVARLGSDKAVIIAWSGWIAKEILTFDLSKITEIAHAIKVFMYKYKVAKNRVIADSDGVGGGVVDILGIKSFVNNAKPIRQSNAEQNYKNLQVQCLYLLADKINDGALWIACENLTEQQKEEIKEELAQIQSAPNKRDEAKLDCKNKGDIRSDINRSPDYRDSLFMRVFFDLKSKFTYVKAKWT
jgi:phage terminase large subunit